MIRYSRDSDKENIKALVTMCFGDDIIHDDAYENLNDRYLVYDMDGFIVSMTGLCFKSEHKNIEIDWYCTHPRYRKRSYMHTLLDRLLSTTDEAIYCSSWRVKECEYIGLHHFMENLGFECVDLEYKKYKCVSEVLCRGNKSKNGKCECCEDLYLRRSK